MLRFCSAYSFFVYFWICYCNVCGDFFFQLNLFYIKPHSACQTRLFRCNFGCCSCLMTEGGFNSLLALLSSQTQGFVMVCFEWTDFMWKWGKVNKFEYFQDTLCNHLPGVYCVLMHTESGCFVTWVFLCSRVCTMSQSSSGSWWSAREDCVRLFNNVCWAFQQKH